MRSIRLAAAALVAAGLAACSNDVTGPARATPTGPSLTESCRAGYMLSSGRCSGAAKAPTAGTGEVGTQGDQYCRVGYLLINGRCVPE